MSTSQHSFIDIFNSTFDIEGTQAILTNIVIPKIQRDYAQGRNDSAAGRVRNRFLDSLKDAITGNPITLDFIYGDIDSKGKLTPLDGQQRLTTLFLLHWYAAKKEDIEESKYKFLYNFTYETRYTARDFCKCLIDFTPSFNKTISEEIINQSWFPLEWKKDPTIKSMLTMLDAISDKFSSINNIWEMLESNKITFHFLPIKDMGLTDELYIKMNSRGKPLTPFEHFKAELERKLKAYDENIAKRILKKVDVEWTDLLWTFKDEDISVDEEFLNYFKFICDILYYKHNQTPAGKSRDEFDLLNEHFDSTNDPSNIKENVELLEKYFDCWSELKTKTEIDSFFNKFISKEYEPDKTRVANKDAINSFEDCLKDTQDTESSKITRNFKQIIMLYAAITYQLNKNNITEEQFARRIRIVNNLVSNSQDETSDSEDRAGGNRMPAILKQIDSIIVDGKIIDLNIPNFNNNNFNSNQLEEEKKKIEWVNNNSSIKEQLYKLEANELLYGQVSIVGLDNTDKADNFNSLFSCNLDKVDKALMAIGLYGQYEPRTKLTQFGSGYTRSKQSWDNLFHKSSNEGHDVTKKCLLELLSNQSTFSDELLDKIASDYLKECETKKEFDFRYYYIKYDSFRPQRYGKYKWWDKTKPYELLVLHSKSKASEKSYQPFLKEIDSEKLDIDNYGKYLIYDNSDVKIEALNDKYIIKRKSTDEKVEEVNVVQNSSGIDAEDRIAKMRVFIKGKSY